MSRSLGTLCGRARSAVVGSALVILSLTCGHAQAQESRAAAPNATSEVVPPVPEPPPPPMSHERAGGASAEVPLESDALGTRPGASTDLRARLLREPTFWTTLRAQYEPATQPEALPRLPSMQTLTAAPIRITLREAVLTAVQNNPAMIAESLNPTATEQGILAAEAQFDPIFAADAGFGRSVTPSSSLLQGTEDVSDNDLVQVPANWNFSLSKLLRSGGTARLEWLNERFNTDNAFTLLMPSYTPELLLTVNQPLLRGFGLYFTNLRIELAEKATDASIAQYRATVANFILRVITQYWAVVGLRERLDVLKASYELAQRTVRENRTRVDVGVLPPVAVLESQAESARRHEEVISATNDLEQARRTLRQLVYLPSENPFFPKAVEPIESPKRARVAVDTEHALLVAIEKRYEIDTARLTIQGTDINSALAKNELLPRVDLVGSAGVNSLAGAPNPNPFSFRTPAPGQSTDIPWTGSYGDALNRLPDGRFYSYFAGVRVEVPIGNAAAEAAATRARVEQQQAYARYREVVSQVSLEVGQAAGDVRSDMERVETTRVARELSEENLRNQTKRYEVGMVTTTDLLQFQNDVASARVAEIQALIEYNISLIAFERAQGTLLDSFQVIVDARQPTQPPWWAKF